MIIPAPVVKPTPKKPTSGSQKQKDSQSTVSQEPTEAILETPKADVTSKDAAQPTITRYVRISNKPTWLKGFTKVVNCGERQAE